MRGFTTFDDNLAPMDALVSAGLDWTVEKQDLVTSSGYKAPKHQGVVRSDTKEVIGIVGRERGMIQNREHVDFVQALIDQLGANVAAAGSMDHGAQVFFALDLPEPTVLHGEYRIDHTAISASSHNSTRSLSMRLMSTALLCTNQLTGAAADLRIRHSKNVEARLNEAVKAESVLRSRINKLESKLEHRIETPFDENSFWKFVENQFPFEPGKQQLPVQEKRDALMDIYRRDTQSPFRGTLFAAVTAVEEYFDWRYGADESRAARQLLRLNDPNKSKMINQLVAAAS